ncbi:E3 ubiquitin-protein ligase MIEL1 [Artemisia annua]|nr:E3 ubiquitin-protein ligase MIEL1 [Artemisia annua]
MQCHTLMVVNHNIPILCNDCNYTSTKAFHILSYKCSHCKSYDTQRIGSTNCVEDISCLGSIS